MNTLIYEKTKDGEIIYDIFSRLAKERIIFISDTITQELAANVAANILWFTKGNKSDKPINIYINSHGGSSDAMFTIIDMMNYVKAPIYTYGLGFCASAAAVILACGEKGNRFLMPNSRVMLHEIQVTGISGSAREVKSSAKEIERVNRKALEILSERTGKDLEIIQRDIEIDRYFSSEEAIEYGLVDRLL